MSDFYDDTQTQQMVVAPGAATGARQMIALTMLGMGALIGLGLIVAGALANLSSRNQPMNVTLIVNNAQMTVSTTRATVRDLLTDQQIDISGGALVQPPLHSRITPGMTITVNRGRTVSITVDGLTTVYRTLYDNPAEILASAGVALAPSAIITVNGARITPELLPGYPLPANRITVDNAREITIFTGDPDVPQPLTLRTTAENVGEALAQAGVVLYLGDEVSVPLDAPVSDGLSVRIVRSVPLTIVADGVTTETRAQGETVGAALAQAGVVLAGLDYSIPPENALLSPGMRVEVIRVTEEVLTEQTPVPFQTVYQADDALELDARRVLQVGTPGVDQRSIRVRYENGVETRRYDEGTTRIQPPQDQVVAYGTQIVLRTLETPDGTLEYWRKLRMYATSYHPGSVGGNTGTSIGRTLTKGIVAIDPRVIPYNTRLYVPGYGIGEAADTGGPRSHRYWIDLGYDDENWVSWSRWVDVYLITPVPDRVIYLLP